MAITNYTNLQSTISDYLNRDDLDAVIPTFIQLAESQINRDVRHWKMQERASGQQSAGDRYMQFPADWNETNGSFFQVSFFLSVHGSKVSGNKQKLQNSISCC